MINFRVPVLLSVVFILIATIACSVPGMAGPAALPTSTLIDINALNQPTVAPPSGNSSGAGATSGACSNPLYPVVAGATWSYSFNGATPGNFTRSITAVNADGFSDQDVFDSGISRNGEWKCENGALIALKPDSGSSTASAQTQSFSATFQTTSMDGVTIPATINSGDTWSQNFTMEGTQTINGQEIASKNKVAFTCTAGATESVTVPAGTFNAMHMDCTSNIDIIITMNGADIPTSVSTTSTMWYAPGVGMVKSDNVVSGASNTTLELTAYNIP